MPPRSLTATLFGAAAALWGLLVGVLVTLLAPGAGEPGIGFWTGLVLAIGAGAGAGATGGHTLARRHARAPRKTRSGGIIRFALGGVALLLGAGIVALAAGLLLTALAAGAGNAWGGLRQALARPERLVWSVAGIAFIGLPVGAAAGVVLRALVAPPPVPPPNDSASEAGGSPRRPLR